MGPPAVSLIIPTRGDRPSLAQALESALAQNFPSIEIVVVDDARPDSGWRQNAEHASWLSDPRVRVVSFRQGRGCAAAKNAGLRAALGEWVCYLDDDNEYRPDKVAAQHALATASGSSLVLCGLEIRAGGRRVRRQVDRDRFQRDDLLLVAIPDTNVLFHRRETAPEWDEELGTVDDACFFQAYVTQEGLQSVPNVPRALAIYRAHLGPRANRGFERHYRGQRRLIVRWSRNYGEHAQQILLLRALVSFCKFRRGGWSRLARLGWRLVRTGDWREWRLVANAMGVKLPVIRRWMVT